MVAKLTAIQEAVLQECVKLLERGEGHGYEKRWFHSYNVENPWHPTRIGETLSSTRLKSALNGLVKKNVLRRRRRGGVGFSLLSTYALPVSPEERLKEMKYERSILMEKAEAHFEIAVARGAEATDRALSRRQLSDFLNSIHRLDEAIKKFQVDMA